MIRESVKGSKLEGAFRKKKRKVSAESEHTITILPQKCQPVILAKRDIAEVIKHKPKRKKMANIWKLPKTGKLAVKKKTNKEEERQLYK